MRRILCFIFLWGFFIFFFNYSSLAHARTIIPSQSFIQEIRLRFRDFLKVRSGLLELPIVIDNEIRIDSRGIASLSDYVKYFADRAHKEMNFDRKKLANILKNNSNVPLFPADLVDKGLREGNFNTLIPSFLITRDFIEAKISFLREVRIKRELIQYHKTMIGVERLTLSLVGKVLEKESGTLSHADFVDYYRRYQETIVHYRRQFNKDYHAAARGSGSIFERISAVFIPRTQALGADIGFGGLITLIENCECEGDLEISLRTVGVTSLSPLHISIATLSSPLFYQYKLLAMGTWFLGFYNPGVYTCSTAAAYCYPSSAGVGRITTTGTSL
ncbi:MAG: hypothetical protein A3A04_01140 [Candidatus Harrisonbacteria bacterium RIFCSPLOWO2_01_FULL_40_28]|uniref:Uncharacterized protein n=1 Tax=Candidatus Harrisonbacteria bacterium RIFCSPLOWO2_01_FULL_40_28 TaxID=1798406 RepID=A0A1G1ZMR2_9BACT|nr:MAG: hypothetical protein A3A04_01140 [Candidatus Harrisonbacteria bacterium RIFCSPLOWO2_01_FULL_40_28]